MVYMKVDIQKLAEDIEKYYPGDEPLRWKTPERTRKIEKFYLILNKLGNLVERGGPFYDHASIYYKALYVLKWALYEEEMRKNDVYPWGPVIKVLEEEGIAIIKEITPAIQEMLRYLLNTSEEKFREQIIPSAYHYRKCEYTDSLIKSINSADFGRFCEFIDKGGFCNEKEFVRFFYFGQECYDLVKNNGINYIFLSDTSARILGTFLHHLFNTNGLAKVSCQFVLTDGKNGAKFHHPSQERLVKGKNVLVIDEYISEGTTLNSMMNLMFFARAKNVLSLFFAYNDCRQHYKNSHYMAGEPSWYHYVGVSGLIKEKNPLRVVVDWSRDVTKARKYVKELSYWVAKAIKMQEKI